MLWAKPFLARVLNNPLKQCSDKEIIQINTETIILVVEAILATLTNVSCYLHINLFMTLVNDDTMLKLVVMVVLEN